MADVKTDLAYRRSSGMTLRRLQQHINAGVEENERHPLFAEEKRNDMPICIRLRRRTKTGRIRDRYIEVEAFWIGRMGVNGKSYSMVVEAQEEVPRG